MRTSHLQYLTMVEFMEANGDLSRPSNGPRGRIKWKVLTHKLNNKGTGMPRSEAKWRKVWSDYKNNCKRKCLKIKRATSDPSGGPPLRLSDLERRVIKIIRAQAATGKAMAVEEAGFQQDEVIEISQVQLDESTSQDPLIFYEKDWNTPSTSRQQTLAPPSPSPSDTHLSSQPVTPDEEDWKQPPQKKKAKGEFTKMFIEADRETRQYARERDTAYEELEKERLLLKSEELRVRELEIVERVRQRDVELRLQAQWLEFFKEGMEVFVRYMEKKL